MENSKMLATDINLSTEVNEGKLIDIREYGFVAGLRLPVILTLGAWDRCIANLDPFSIEADTKRTIVLIHALCRALGTHRPESHAQRFQVPVRKKPNQPEQLIEVETETCRDVSGMPFVLVRLVDEEEWAEQN